jgi:uncharacterized membrane protein YagU involved in acid resistance
MDAKTLNQEIKSGNANFIQPPQPQTPEVLPPDDSMSQFLGFLTTIRQPRSHLTVAPTFTPKTFLDQIQFYDDGSNRRMYFYTNKVWRYIVLT